ncbi:hypothetical protein HYV88_01085 [Candidatus Woesearchaeota archaeon]|nr:hypothetical protein [Candidatus Woesearchaeota archaeon]
MNKKGEIIIISGIIIVAIAFLGLYYIENKLIPQKELQYIGDTSTKIAYNLRSENSECNLNLINIEKRNIIFFENIQEINSEGYIVDTVCF